MMHFSPVVENLCLEVFVEDGDGDTDSPRAELASHISTGRGLPDCLRGARRSDDVVLVDSGEFVFRSIRRRWGW